MSRDCLSCAPPTRTASARWTGCAAAAGDGQLTMEELDERVQRGLRRDAPSGELERLTADLQAPDHAATGQGGRVTVRPGEGGARWLVAIMGGCDRKGRWRLAARATSLNIMGGADLDLDAGRAGGGARRADRLLAAWAAPDVYVPEGLNVEVSDFALHGRQRRRYRRARTRPARARSCTCKLISIMGGTNVRRGPKLSRAERKALRQQRRAPRPLAAA